MKLKVFILGGQTVDQKRKKGWLRELIRRERRDGREARGNEEKEKRED